MDLKRYGTEIRHIIEELNNLESGKFYEVEGDPGTTSAKTIGKNVRISFLELLAKISKDKESTADPLSKFFDENF